MNLEKATRWQSTIGRAGTLLCVLFVLAGFDGLVTQFRTPPNEFRIIPGETVSVNGPCGGNIESVSQLFYESSSQGIALRFEAIHAGFWLGGTMWRGALMVDHEAQPGDYRVVVKPVNDPQEKPFAIFSIRVFSNANSLQSASRSYIQRQFGISPWLLFSVSLLLSGLAFGIVYGISQKRDSLMAVEGRAEIYRLARGEDSFEVSFGLGSIQGIQAGHILTLLNKRGERIGEVKVIETFDEDSTGTVSLDIPVQPGQLVVKNR
jgi:hypothetical protein